MMPFLFSKAGRYAVAAVVAVVAFVAFKSSEQRKGATKALAAVERNNATVSKKAAAAGAKSVDPSSPGVRLPYYRPD